ncbi:uncharacterized protein LOC110977325, partial [Acanthaster planci]|uniref:Uncharacterized protein LOC110977325 n=1 Tax=Acanthaster planci TaxID=133434 RepID=A0A8B7Y1I0_ACAPL
TCQPRDEVKRTQPQKPDETRSEKEQSGATPQEEDKVGKTQADDGATPQEEEKVGKTQADDGATPQEEQKVGKTQADDGATPQEEQKMGKTQADDGATPQEEEKVGKTQADDGATPQEEQKVGKTQADDGATPQEEEKVGKTQADGEDKPLTIWCMKGNLQIFVQYPVLHGQKILCLQLHKEIAVSSLKELIHKRIGVKPKLQHLHIRRNTHNFQLQDLLTLNDCGVQQDQTILLRLSTDGLLGGGPTGELPDETLRGMSEKIPAQKLMKLGIELDFRRSEITKIDGTKRCPADKFFELLIRWRNKQPGDVNQTEALCKALKEVGETRLADDLAGGASLQSGQPSGGMSENQSSTSQQLTTQTAVSHSLTPGSQQ